jgi:hypothetical protein
MLELWCQSFLDTRPHTSPVDSFACGTVKS